MLISSAAVDDARLHNRFRDSLPPDIGDVWDLTPLSVSDIPALQATLLAFRCGIESHVHELLRWYQSFSSEACPSCFTQPPMAFMAARELFVQHNLIRAPSSHCSELARHRGDTLPASSASGSHSGSGSR